MPTVAELSIEVTVQDRGAQEDILRLQQMLQRLATEDPDISVRVSAENARREFEDLQRRAQELEANSVNIETEADARVAMAQLEELQRAMRALDRSTVNVDVDIDTQGALAHIAALQVALKAIRDERIEVDRDGSGAKSLNQISAAAQRASGTIRGLTTAILALWPALVPISAVGVTGLLAFTAATVAAGAGIGLFAAVAMTTFAPIVDVIKKMTAAQKAYDQAVTDKQKETALAKLKALYESLDPAQQKLVTSFMKLRDAWRDFAEQFRPEIFVMASEAMDFLSASIPKLTPLMTNATKAIHQLQTESIAAFKNPVWQEFFSNLTNNAGPAIISFGHILGNLATGFVGILNAFFPFQKGVMGGLEELTRKFAVWGATLGDSPGFKKFIAYVRENTPLVTGLLKSLGDAFVQLVIAAAPVGEQILKILTKVFDGIKKLGEMSSISLTGLLVFAGISAIFVNMIGPILAVINIIQLLLPLFGLISTGYTAIATAVYGFLAAWGLIILVVAAVIAALVGAYVYFDEFRAKVDELGAKFKEIGSNIMDAVGPAFKAVLTFFQEEWQKFIEWWGQNSQTFNKAWDNIKSATEQFMTWLVQVVTVSLDAVLAVWNAIWPGLSNILQGVWEIIKGIVSGAFNIIRGLFTVFAAIIAGDWGKVWDGVVMILFGVWDIIYGVIRGAIQIVLGILQILWAGVTALWDGIVGAFKQGASAAAGFLVSTWNGIVSVISSLWGGIVDSAKNFVDTIVGFFQWLYDVLIGSSIIPDLVNGVIQWWQQMVAFLMSVMAPVVSTLVLVWETIKAAVSAAVEFILNVVTNVWNAIVSVTSSVWNAIVSAVTTAINAVSSVIMTVINAINATWSAIWTAIQQVAQVVWTAIQSLIQIAIFAVQAVIAATMAAINGDWSTAWNIISNAASTIWAAIKAVINTAIQAIHDIISTTLNTIKDIWTKVWNSLVDAVKTAASNVMAAIRGIVSDITSAFSNLASLAFNWGKNLISGFVDGIKSMAGAAGDAALGVLNKVASVMPGSPAETGPLSGHGYVKLRGQRFVEDLAAGLGDTGALSMTMKDIADIMSLNANPSAAFDAIASPLSSIAGAFDAASTGTGSSVTLTIAPGAVVLQIPAGMDPAAARAAFDGAQDTMAEALLTAVQKRQSS